MMMKRTLGKSGIEVSAMGLGCWAIGGPWTNDNAQDEPNPGGWGKIDDKESIRAIHAGLGLGINFFDTAANYGAGHSETVLGKALAGKRDQVVVATKFGYLVDEKKKYILNDPAAVPGNIRKDCENSLRRLNTDYIDIYQLHVGDYPPEKAPAVMEILEDLVKEGKIRWYGWSTDNPEGARAFGPGEHCATIQHILNVFIEIPTMLDVIDEFNLGSINKAPLFMGLLTGKFNPDSTFPGDDVRQGWTLKDDKRGGRRLKQLEAVREVLTSDGRTLAQAALGWIWARHERTVPIPGFKTVKQVEENVKAMEFGPLKEDQMQEIERLLEKQQAG
jgi:aryl-alcohol dehydrogenase-like predicted oxidoreductase